MIYLIYGNNFSKTRSKLQEILSLQIKKKPDASYFKLNSENWDTRILDEFISSQGLFESKYIVVVDSMLSNKDSYEEIKTKLKEISASPNIFIFIDGSLTKEMVNKVSKYSEKIQEFSDKKEGPTKIGEINVFTMTDALGARDKKRLWIMYQKAIFVGMEPEEIFRLFFWQIKSMLISQMSKSAKDAGLNPFVYKKSLGFAKNFKKDELNKLSSNLIRIYHDARRGILDFNIALERFVLEI
ncbi:MAG: hypothetical protein COV95_01525 [Candidatus Zambryskibacteria bacterium CG11_big_fil_rev_8_21_14_0_20_40_24]|uniref:DNA polymerase III delta subunit-like C-terminal domain-containing protein n=1 Tax=Candidatus Zambryskibacteria bacterium CG11_big_fil_rev_8_21_14_0_20_40_24 TaxID=1975116 RepID=A0A2H0K6Q2_9BACT|nr:MAG: hypothetical protein COV95_01525 [Candidatus Zambryskibacteria bacterium CG11_big_fil_rev_8_21_14_0_20_40_24]